MCRVVSNEFYSGNLIDSCVFVFVGVVIHNVFA